MDDDFLSEVKRDAVPVPHDEQLARVAVLAARQQVAEATIRSLEEHLKNAKEKLREISEGDLPEAMTALGLREFKLTDGSKVSIKPYYGLRIDDAVREEAFSWLEENNHGDIVKHTLSVETRLTNEALLDKVRALALKLQLDVADKIGIHHMTGSAWVKRQLEAGEDPPRELLGISTGFRAKVEGPK